MAPFLNLLEWSLSRVSLSRLEKICDCLASLLFGWLRIRRSTVLRNLDIVYGEAISQERKCQMGRSSLRCFLQTVLELVGAPRFYPQMRMEILNEEIILQAIAKGRGVYGLGIHQGDWEYAIHTCSRWGRVNMALKPIGGKSTARWVRERRRELGVHEVPRNDNKPAWRIMVECLQRGEIVAMVVDQRRSKGEVVPLFGKPAWTNASIFRLWRSHPAPIIPMTIRRTGVGRHEVMFWDELKVLDSPDWNEGEFLIQNAQQMNRLVEQMILWNPDEYFWMHNRWKGYGPSNASNFNEVKIS